MEGKEAAHQGDEEDAAANAGENGDDAEDKTEEKQRRRADGKTLRPVETDALAALAAVNAAEADARTAFARFYASMPDGTDPVGAQSALPADVALRNGRTVRLRATGIELSLGLHDRFEIVDARPLSAVVTSELTMAIGRGEWQTRVETHARMWSDAERFFVANRIEAFEGDERVFADEEQLTFPRDLV